MTTQSSRRFAIGVQSFPVMRQGGFVYVDKTHHVWQLSNCFGNYILLSRPRRFGKSLLCSTFKAYFEGRREMFEDLRIAEMDSAWRSHAVILFDALLPFYAAKSKTVTPILFSRARSE